jgi:hypothetical protein
MELNKPIFVFRKKKVGSQFHCSRVVELNTFIQYEDFCNFASEDKSEVVVFYNKQAATISRDEIIKAK